MSFAVDALQWFFLAYFIGVNLVYIALNLLAAPTLRRYREIASWPTELPGSPAGDSASALRT